MSLPFKLYKYHKNYTKQSWKKNGLIMDNFDEIYNRYIYATHCELCNKQFVKSIDRCMDHNHETSEFRNIVCQRCNQLKADVKKSSNNTSGYKGISKSVDKTCRQGFIWQFSVQINGKSKTIKSSVNKELVIEFAEKWKKENNYHT